MGSLLHDPNAAPLEQNIKNLECDGVIYKVIKEDVDPKKHYINVLSHKRSVKPGNHRKKLNSETVEQLDEALSEVLELFHYR